MPPKISQTGELELRSKNVPLGTRTYSPLGHGEIIDIVKKELINQGFCIVDETYRSTKDLDIAVGTYKLLPNDASLIDSEIGMMIAWRNSYDKTASFKCGIGGKVFVCDNGMISSDMSSMRKVHRGAGLIQSVNKYITDEINNAARNMKNLYKFRDQMKDVLLSKKDKALILGDIFLNHSLMTSNQFSVIKKELENASYVYRAHSDSAWVLYNHITHALKESHPIRYIEDHKDIYEYFSHEVLANQQPSPRQEVIENPQWQEELKEQFETSTNTFGVIF